MVILDKKKQYWGAYARRDKDIERIQIMSENYNGPYKVFKGKRFVTFITNADTIHVEGIGNVSTSMELWEGEYIVTFSKPDHRTEIIRISVAEENLTITKNLVRIQGTLHIHSSPVGVNVFVNNVNRGTTPLSLSSFVFGNYAISLTMAGYYTDTFNVGFNTHPQTVSRNLTLIPAPPDPPTPPQPPEPPVIPGIPPGTSHPSISWTLGHVFNPITSNSARLNCLIQGATGFEIHLNGSWLGSFNTSSSYHNVVYQINNLKSSTTYSVRIVAVDFRNGTSISSQNLSFTTLAAPAPPSNLKPGQ
jgi:hypothetical protein